MITYIPAQYTVSIDVLVVELEEFAWIAEANGDYYTARRYREEARIYRDLAEKVYRRQRNPVRLH